MDIEYVATQIALDLKASPARQHEYWRIDFPDGLSLSVKKTWRDKLYIGLMLGNMRNNLKYNEASASAEFKTANLKYIVSYIRNNILPEAREQFARAIRVQQELEEAARGRRDVAGAIAAQFSGKVTEGDRYDFYKSAHVHQYGKNNGGRIVYASYEVEANSVDVKASLSPDIAMWLAYVIERPEYLKKMSDCLP